MKKARKHVLLILGGLAVLFFCISAVANASTSFDIAYLSFSEPLNILLLGFILVGFGSIIRGRYSKD